MPVYLIVKWKNYSATILMFHLHMAAFPMDLSEVHPLQSGMACLLESRGSFTSTPQLLLHFL